jgi:H+/Cl- antiporter ClcA
VKKAVLYWFMACWIVTIFGYLLTVLFAVVFKPPTSQELSFTVTRAPAHLMTLPYHPLLNLLVWPIFAWWYLRRTDAPGGATMVEGIVHRPGSL